MNPIQDHTHEWSKPVSEKFVKQEKRERDQYLYEAVQERIYNLYDGVMILEPSYRGRKPRGKTNE